MPTAKKAAPKKAAAQDEPTAKAETKAPKDSRVVAKAEIDAETARRNAREAALISEAPAASPDPKGDIDQRMAALLKDHQRMGARPS